MTLDEWLEFNVGFVEKAAPLVQPGGDLEPMFVIHKDGWQSMEINLPSFSGPAAKDKAIAALRQRLAKTKADRYAIISASWVMQFTPGEDVERGLAIINEHGTSDGTELETRRRECYTVTVGDKTKSLGQTLLVTRDAAGRIAGLERQPPTSSDNFATGPISGRTVDLLVPEH